MPGRTTSVSAKDLSDQVVAIFDDVQTSRANHHKNTVKLHKLQSTVAQPLHNNKPNLRGEDRFETIFFLVLSAVMVLKKGDKAADRVLEFVREYVKLIQTKGALDHLSSRTSSYFHNSRAR